MTHPLLDLPVHPAAAVFPMLTDDELAELAEDIKANGLLHPIKLDAEGSIVDGRNRYVACRLAGVEPSFVQFGGDDIVTFVLSENIRRRHMSKGQQAMVVARLRLVSRQSIREATPNGISHQRVGQAAVVLECAPEMADSVISGSLSLDDAYAEARQRKDAASSMEAQMGRLRSEEPELADLVAEERITLREALALLDKRRANERRRREAATAGLLSAVRILAPPSGDIAEHAGKLIASFDPTLVSGAEAITSKAIERAIAFLEVILVGLDEWEEAHGRTQAQSVSP